MAKVRTGTRLRTVERSLGHAMAPSPAACARDPDMNKESLRDARFSVVG